MNMNRKSLFAGRVAANKKLFDGTVPSNKTCLLELFSSRINLYIFPQKWIVWPKKRLLATLVFQLRGYIIVLLTPCQATDVQI